MTAAVDVFDTAHEVMKTADEEIAVWAGDGNRDAGRAALEAIDEVIEQLRQCRGLLAVELSGAVVELPDDRD